jgi:CheY-like chemotaxis protein
VTASVLVIDDDDAFRALTARMLRSWGHAVVEEAENFADGLARTVDLRPDVVLVDVGLPDGDGLVLAERIAAQPWQPLVVIVSSDAEAADDEAVLRAGAVAFVPKEDLPNGRLRAMLDTEMPPAGA